MKILQNIINNITSFICILYIHLSLKEGRFHLASGLDSLPDAEVADDPGNGQTDNQVPVQGPNVINTWGNSQDSAPGAHTYITDI